MAYTALVQMYTKKNQQKKNTQLRHTEPANFLPVILLLFPWLQKAAHRWAEHDVAYCHLEVKPIKCVYKKGIQLFFFAKSTSQLLFWDQRTIIMSIKVAREPFRGQHWNKTESKSHYIPRLQIPWIEIFISTKGLPYLLIKSKAPWRFWNNSFTVEIEPVECFWHTFHVCLFLL